MGNAEAALLAIGKRGEIEPEDPQWYERNTGNTLKDVQGRVTHPVIKRCLVLIRIHSPDDFAQRTQHYRYVEPETPIVYIPEVVFDPFLHFFQGLGLTTTSVHLRPPSDAGLHVMAEGILFNLLEEKVVMRSRMRPRTDNGHFATQNIDKLRNLVDAGLTDQCT
jgi:hypothetical protein